MVDTPSGLRAIPWAVGVAPKDVRQTRDLAFRVATKSRLRVRSGAYTSGLLMEDHGPSLCRTKLAGGRVRLLRGGDPPSATAHQVPRLPTSIVLVGGRLGR